MELHREIERLMQNNLEYQDKFEEMKKKKEELEKAKSLREAKTNYLTQKKIDSQIYNSLSNFSSQAALVAKKEIKLLKIGKKGKGKGESNDT